MDWKKISINAISALVVAIVSGLLVWWLTRPPANQEGLIFKQSTAVSFDVGKQAYTFSSVRVANTGDAPAKDVTLTVLNSKGATLESHSVATSRSRPMVYIRRNSQGFLTVTLPVLLPSEALDLAVLYTARGPVVPEVIVKSSNSLAKRYLPQASNPWSERLRLFFAFLIVAIVPVFLAKMARRNMGIFLDLMPSKNDSGFLILHSGLAKEASDIFGEAIKSGSNGSLILSNYGASLAILGEHDRADRLIYTAEEWAKTPNQRGTVLLNRAIAEFCVGKVDQALDSMKDAKRASTGIETYFRRSKLCQELFANNPEFAQVFA